MITERAINRLAANYRGGGAHDLAYLEHAKDDNTAPVSRLPTEKPLDIPKLRSSGQM